MSNLFRSSPMFDSVEIIRQPVISREPKILGSCSICGVDVPVGEHLYKLPGDEDRWTCEACDEIHV